MRRVASGPRQSILRVSSAAAEHVDKCVGVCACVILQIDHVFVQQGCYERWGMYGHNDDLMVTVTSPPPPRA